MNIPSCVHATSPISTVSDRYGFIPTHEVINAFNREGWQMTKATAVKVRKPSKEGFQRHLIRFVHESQINTNSGNRMETVFINSHDKTSGVVLASGIFRFACANGLIVADSTIQGFKLYHTGLTMDRVLGHAHDLLQQQEKVSGTIEQWKSIKLNQDQKVELAQAGINLRWGNDQVNQPLSPSVVLLPNRIEDMGSDLWTVFNIVQENIIRGGLIDRSRTRFDGRSFRSVRPIKSISADLAINTGLWQAANDLALAS